MSWALPWWWVVVGAWRGGVDERLASGIGGVASFVFGVLALAWPDLTVLVVALLVGPVAIVLGGGQVVRAVRDRPVRVVRRPRWHLPRAVAALALALVLLGVSAFLHSGDVSLDSFYDASAAATDKPGTLLDDQAFTRTIPADAKAVRMVYATTGPDGRPQAASGLVVVPKQARGPVPVILWTHGTTGVARRCAPSALGEPFTAGAMFVLPQVIARGWALVAPDYPGLGTKGKHPYLVGEPAARSALDAVRAARRIHGLRLSDKTVAWGHSQGGVLPCGWVSRTTATRPTCRWRASPRSRPPATWWHWPAACRPALPEGSSRASRLRENIPDRVTGIPTLIAQGLDDQLVLPDVQQRFAAGLCAAGQPVDFHEYAGRDHVAIVAADSPLIPDLLRCTQSSPNCGRGRPRGRGTRRPRSGPRCGRWSHASSHRR